MPIDFNLPFQDYIKNQETTQLARLYRLQRQDGYTLRCTDWKMPIRAQVNTPSGESETEIFKPVVGFDSSALTVENRLNVDTLDLSSYFQIPDINKEDIYARRYHNAIIQIYIVSPELDNITTPVYQRIRGEVGEITELSIDTFKLEFRSLSQTLQQKIGLTVEESCPWSLGDSKCKVNLNNYTHNGIIVSSTSKRKFLLNFSRVFASNYFAGGYLRYLDTGRNYHSLMDIESSVTSGSNTEITLSFSLPFLPLQGEQVTVAAGCKKTIAACQSFNNVANFGGFPFLPGRDRLLRGEG